MSHPRWISCAAAVVLFTALVSLVSPLHAQQQETWVRCDTCWRYFDSSQTRFLIGAVDMKFPLLARELGIDFTKLYGLPNPANLWSIIQNPGAGALTVNDSATRLLDTLVRNLWLAADTTGYRVVSRFPNTSEVIYATRRLETYLWDNRWAQMFHALERFFGNDETSYFAVVPEADRDTVMHGMVYAATMRDSTNHTLKLVGAGVRYAAKELFHLGNRHLYKAIGSPERTTMFRVSVAMKVNLATSADSLLFDTLSPTAELARIVVYRRARQGQIILAAPKAWIYEPFDTVVIRKSDYIDDEVSIVEDGYRELGATIDMKRSQQVLLHDTVVYHTWVRGPGDTVSALSLMSPDPVGFETDIAADSLAGVDSLVYVRMFVYAPINLDYTMSTGFQFIEDPVNYFPKRVRRSNGDESSGEAQLSLSIHPNPANDRTTTVVVNSPFGDEATSLELYDITGMLLYDLGPVVLKEGYGSGQLDVSQLKSGVYSLVIHQKGKVASTRLTVVR